MPHFRNPLVPKTLERWQERDLVFERVAFQGRHGQAIPGLLAFSELARTRPLPVLLCMPGSPNVKEDLLFQTGLMRTWADRGFFVLSIDRPYHGNRPGKAVDRVEQKGLLSVWGESLYDLMRAIDYAEWRGEADATRLGMLGLSMGGMEALWLAAIDERVDVVVSVAGHLAWDPLFASGAWREIFQGHPLTAKLSTVKAGEVQARRAFFEQEPGMEAVDARSVVPLMAPRPLLLMVGEQDPIMPVAATRSVFHAALPFYERQPDQLKLSVRAGIGHNFTRDMQAQALEWFIAWLGDPLNPAASDD